MTKVLRYAALSALLLATACATPARFGGGGDDPFSNNVDLNAGLDGSASDPTSPAFFTQTVGDRVFFIVDQSTLTPEAQATLESQAQWLLTNTDYEAIIEGHADERGTREYNLALGARRASAVQDFLVTQGVAPNRLQPVTYGKERPLEICSEEACYNKNRRAVTVLSAGPVS